MLKFKRLFLTIVVILSLGIISQVVIPEMYSSSVVQAANVKISKTKYTMNKGETYKLKIKGTNKKVKWGTSNKKIATVNSNGKVKAKKKGTVTITAKVSGKKYKCKIKVEEPTINKTKKTLNVGDTFKLKIRGTSQTVNWSSSNKKIAKVNKNGRVTAKKAGTVTITAKAGATKYKCKITVNPTLYDEGAGIAVENNGGYEGKSENNRKEAALQTAKNYLKVSDFSKESLKAQLKYEKFADDEIEYAVNNCGANWNKEALDSAKNYIKYSDFSKESLKEQLKFEKFTDSQISYAIDNCGANWKQEALSMAKKYLEISSFSEKGLRNQLKFEQFTDSEIDYAIKNCGANWNQEAEECAMSYFRNSSLSTEEVYEQLKFEGFTDSQIEYALSPKG